MTNDELFFNIFKENMIHLIHQETQRMWIANIFMSTVAGVVAYLTTTFNSEITFCPLKIQESNEISWFVPLAFLIISSICLLVTLKLNDVFNEAKKSAIKIFEDEKISLGTYNRLQYVGMLKSTSIVGKILKVRCLYIALYIIAIIASIIWLCITLKEFWYCVFIVMGTIFVLLILLYPGTIKNKFKDLDLRNRFTNHIKNEYKRNP
jgi:hypothetical protein